jgi:hypothetical protein
MRQERTRRPDSAILGASPPESGERWKWESRSLHDIRSVSCSAR